MAGTGKTTQITEEPIPLLCPTAKKFEINESSKESYEKEPVLRTAVLLGAHLITTVYAMQARCYDNSACYYSAVYIRGLITITP